MKMKKLSNEYFVDENNKIRGIITTSSYEARAFGVKTAMSVNEALKLLSTFKNDSTKLSSLS
jgi:DNA polymerase-4